MKPIGSITNFYRFLDAEDQKIMEEILEKATHYVDYVDLLGKKLLEIEASPKLVHVGARIARTLTGFDLLEKLGNKYPDNDLIRPQYIWARVNIGKEEMSALEEACRTAIEAQHDDWITFSFHFLRLFTSEGNITNSKTQQDAISAMDRLVKDNPDLAFLGSYVPYLISIVKRGEGKIDEAIDLRKKSVAIALEFDDYILAIPILRELVPLMMQKDPSEAMRLFENLDEYYPLLGPPTSEDSYYQSIKGLLHLIRGEFDIAVQSFEQAMSLMGKKHQHSTLRNSPHLLAFTYNQMGKEESAIEWAKLALESESTLAAHPLMKPYAHLQLSCAYSKLGNQDEASNHLSLGHELALKVGDEPLLADSYQASSLLDIAQGDVLSAMVSLKQGLEIAERLMIRPRIHSILLMLVDCEIALLGPSPTQSEDSSGMWMDRMDSILREHDFLGIQCLLTLLRAKFRLKQGRYDEARALLKDVTSRAGNPGLHYLNEMVAELQALIEQ
ncbi:MAG: tetratricopeptide repeat protein [Candidatus Thorarchaeota archaeon]|jgi:tetratricopeptide (TPR) repeat protein